MKPEDLPDEEVELWPENVRVKDAFMLMETQWRVGYAGPTGLDYGALPMVFRSLAIFDDDQVDVFDGLRVMEAAALSEMRKK
nr:DUF1799 domain-containing protein [Bordetella petrii]